MPVRFETPRYGSKTKAKGHTYSWRNTKGRGRKLPIPKASEYDREYKWVDSYLSKDFHPIGEQKYPPAGVASIDIANVHEPRLQSRRKPIDLTRTSTTYLDEAPAITDDYILVGDQSKFAPSVKYRVLEKYGPSKAAQPNGTSTKPPTEPAHTQSEHNAQPKQKTKSDRKKTKNGETSKSCPVHPEEKEAKRSVSAPELQNDLPQADGPSGENGVDPPTAERSPPPAPRERDIAPAVIKRKPDNYISRPTKPTLKTRPPPPPKKPKAKPPVPKLAIKSAKDQENEPEVLQRRPADPREKRSGKFNEFVQTDLEKGVADSGQEAPADYAMKYRAGIPPPRTRGPKRLSEYQMQYQWKKGVNSSPLLAAEQIIYNSNPQLAPYSNPDLPPKESEYNRAFKKYDYKPVPVETMAPAKKPKLRRSKSLEVLTPAKDITPNDMPSASPVPADSESERSITPDKLRAAGLRSGKRTEEDKRLLRESLNPTNLFFPHGKVRNVGSEYASNYVAPTHFAYEDGVWKGADPPHIQPAKTPEPVNIKKPEKVVAPKRPARDNNWFREVIELRNKAQEYKLRARGTHFSRSHLAQLYAQQADLWDTVSNSSTLSALSLESAAAMAAASRQAPSDEASTASTVSQKERPQPKPAAKEAWGTDEPSSAKSKSTSVVSLQGSPPGSAGGGSGSTLVAESEQGRVPTPKFRKEHDKAGYKWRHHLDRTTPAAGGALLTSPPQRKKTKSRTKSEPALKVTTSAPKVRCTCKSDDSDQSDSESPTYRINYPDPPYVYRPSDWSEHIQTVKTHTNSPVFHFLPERKMAHIRKSSMPMFGSTRRPVMVPQVAARLVDPYHQHGVEEIIVDEPHADGYVNPVYLGEGEIMQPSALAFISPDDARYALVPRYVPRTLPGPGQLDDHIVDERPSTPKPKSALKAGEGRRKVSSNWAAPAGGLPTRDTHVLVDEEASTDRPLPTKYTQSPPIEKQNKRFPLGVDVMPTLRETLRELAPSTGEAIEDDVLSMSARSVASSCSLASEVLERARNRRDEFWGNNSKNASRS